MSGGRVKMTKMEREGKQMGKPTLALILIVNHW